MSPVEPGVIPVLSGQMLARRGSRSWALGSWFVHVVVYVWAGLLVGFSQACLGHVALGDERPSGLVLVKGGPGCDEHRSP